MVDYVLELCKDGVDQTAYAVGMEGLIIGRASECDIALADSMVSRLHARVWIEDDDLYITDLESRNGVFVNGSRVETGRLDVDDEVIVGNYHFVVAQPVLKESLPDTSAMCTSERADAVYNQIVQEEGQGRLLTLYQAAQLMGSVFDLDELLNQILTLISERLAVERGYILTLAPETGKPEIRASLPGADDAARPPVSQTLIEYVVAEQSGLLTTNAQKDKRFLSSESVVDHEIHAAMCVPLCGRHSIVGALYVDAGGNTTAFTTGDLELLTVVGRVLGVAVENAHLYKVRMMSERLAAIGQATAGIGHCVKNILVGIKGGGEFIDMGMEKSDWGWVNKGWSLVRRSTERIEELVLNLMAFSRDDRPDVEPTKLELLVGEVFDVVRPRAEKCGVSLEFDAGDLEMVYVDCREIFRVILNLVTNAVDACEETGGEVRVSIRQNSQGSYLDVADTGPGIDSDVRPHVFQAFVTTRGSRGTGLGLACCERIVHAHGGEIWVKSVPGEGSTFIVFLPRQTRVGIEQLEEETQVGEETSQIAD